jgi:hypothetical protein
MGENLSINSLGDLRPGDLCITRIGGLPGIVPVGLGQLILGERVRLGRLRFDHVGIVVEGAYVEGPMLPARAPRMVQAMPNGAEEISLTEATHWNAHTAYARLPEPWPGAGFDAASIARKMVEVGVSYSFGSYVMLAATRYGFKAQWLLDRINRRRPGTPALPVEAICSVLADQCLTLAGYEVMRGVKPQVVTPGALGLQLWNRAGVMWGGAAVLG